jgi:Spy/CpxP family protein refolding chaperone
MKRLTTFVFALLVAGSLSFAQTAAPSPAPAAGQKTGDTGTTGKKGHKGGKKGHKGGKKSKKGAGDVTPPPK